MCSMAVPVWDPGPPLPGPFTLTPLKLEPSLQARRLSWEAGAQSPSLLDSVQSGGLWGCPQSLSRLSVPAYEGMESLGSPPPAATPTVLAFELGGKWSSAEPSALLGVQV